MPIDIDLIKLVFIYFTLKKTTNYKSIELMSYGVFLFPIIRTGWQHMPNVRDDPREFQQRGGLPEYVPIQGGLQGKESVPKDTPDTQYHGVCQISYLSIAVRSVTENEA